MQEGRESRVSGPSNEFVKLTRRWHRMKLDVLGIVQEIFEEKHGRLAANHCAGAPVDGRGVTLFFVCHIPIVSPWRTTFGGFLQGTVIVTTERRSTATGGARLVEANTNGKSQT